MFSFWINIHFLWLTLDVPSFSHGHRAGSPSPSFSSLGLGNVRNGLLHGKIPATTKMSCGEENGRKLMNTMEISWNIMEISYLELMNIWMTDDVIHELRVRRYGITRMIWYMSQHFGIRQTHLVYHGMQQKMNIEIELTNIGKNMIK